MYLVVTVILLRGVLILSDVKRCLKDNLKVTVVISSSKCFVSTEAQYFL